MINPCILSGRRIADASVSSPGPTLILLLLASAACGDSETGVLGSGRADVEGDGDAAARVLASDAGPDPEAADGGEADMADATAAEEGEDGDQEEGEDGDQEEGEATPDDAGQAPPLDAGQEMDPGSGALDAATEADDRSEGGTLSVEATDEINEADALDDLRFDASVEPVEPDAGSGGGLPCAVEAVVHRRCTACHSDPPVGTYMPLLTHAHFHAPATTDPSRAYWELAQERVGSTDSPMPPRTATPLSDDERETVLAWLENGAPYADEVCDEDDMDAEGDTETKTDPDAGVEADPGPLERVDTDGLECERFLAHAPNNKSRKFDVGVAIDEYHAMVFEAPWRRVVYGVVVQPVIDNRSVLHHWLLFHEPGAGRDGDVYATSGQHTGGKLIHSWAPGGTALDFRSAGDDVAFEFEPGTYVVEFHYNSGDPAAEDASGVEVCYRRDPPEHIAGITWLGLDHGAEGYLLGAIFGGWASGACLDPSDEWVGVCDPRAREPVHIVHLVPHMHEAGVHMRSVIRGPGGERVLHDAPFDFDTQIGYRANETVMPGETITTTCSFSKPSCSGQATSAEMCYLYAYAYPKGVLEDNGAWGQLAHGDGTCLGQ